MTNPSKSDSPATHTLRIVDLVSVTSLDTDAQLAIRDIRNQPAVRSMMFHDHVIEVNEHLQWLNRLKQDQSQLAFAAVDSNRSVLGVVSLSCIDLRHKKADWGFYVSQEARGSGLGTAVSIAFIDFAFDKLGLEKLNAEVIEGNEPSLRHHSRLQFAEEGFKKSEVARDDRRLGVYLLGLEKAVWREQRTRVAAECEQSLRQIEVKIHWTPETEQERSPVDQIEAARARNNLNWMSILRIALERSPTQSKQIVAEIKKIDEEISGLTQKLII